MNLTKFQGPIEQVGRGRLREVCAKMTSRRSAFSYMDVSRAYVFLAFLEEPTGSDRAVKKAIQCGEHFRIGRTTVENWFNRDLSRWVERMDGFIQLPASSNRPNRKHYSLTQEKLRWIARIRLGIKNDLTFRRFAERVRTEAMNSTDMRDLSSISHATLWRLKPEIERIKEDLKQEYARSNEAALEALRNRHLRPRNAEPTDNFELEGTDGNPF